MRETTTRKNHSNSHGNPHAAPIHVTAAGGQPAGGFASLHPRPPPRCGWAAAGQSHCAHRTSTSSSAAGKSRRHASPAIATIAIAPAHAPGPFSTARAVSWGCCGGVATGGRKAWVRHGRDMCGKCAYGRQGAAASAREITGDAGSGGRARDAAGWARGVEPRRSINSFFSQSHSTPSKEVAEVESRCVFVNSARHSTY